MRRWILGLAVIALFSFGCEQRQPEMEEDYTLEEGSESGPTFTDTSAFEQDDEHYEEIR